MESLKNAKGLGYIKNFLGLQLPEDELASIENPLAEVMSHTCIKSLEFGSTGAVVCGLLAGLRNKSGAGFRSILRTYATVGPLSCITLGPAASVGYMYYNNLTTNNNELANRCYMLRKNQSELAYDRCSLGGYAFGSAIGFASGGSMLVGGAVACTCAYACVMSLDLQGYFQTGDLSSSKYLTTNVDRKRSKELVPSSPQVELCAQNRPTSVTVKSSKKDEAIAVTTTIQVEPKLEPTLRLQNTSNSGNVVNSAVVEPVVETKTTVEPIVCYPNDAQKPSASGDENVVCDIVMSVETKLEPVVCSQTQPDPASLSEEDSVVNEEENVVDQNTAVEDLESTVSESV